MRTDDNQSNPMQAWLDMWQQAAQSWADQVQKWSVQDQPEVPEQWRSLFEQWRTMMTKGLERMSAATGPSAELAARLLSVADLWSTFQEVWLEALEKSQKEGPEAWFDFFTSTGSRQLYETWRERMDSVADALASMPLATDRPASLLKGMVAFWEAALQVGDRLAVPWLEAFDELRKTWSAAIRGDTSAFREFAATWKNAYEKSLGRVLRAPALGMAREYVERLAKSFDAYLAYLIALQEFFGVLDQVGQDAFRQWTAKLSSLGSSEGYPTAKEVYRLWVDTFEQTYKQVFQTPEYANLQAELLGAAVRFKKRFDDAAQDMLKWLPIPTDRELSELYEAFYKLRKKVRKMERDIEDLKARVEPSEKQ